MFGSRQQLKPTRTPSSSTLKDEELTCIFNMLDKTNQGFITTSYLKQVLAEVGLDKGIIKRAIAQLDQDKDGKICCFDFLKIKEMEANIIERALTGRVAIPDWQDFIHSLEEIYEEVKSIEYGVQATYIPQLARVNPNQFGVAVQTVDGQVWCCGDANVPFTTQSCSKPVTYCMAEEDRGEEKIGKHVGHEPSGRKFNAFELDERDSRHKRPFNPMINEGAIVTASLLKPDLEPADPMKVLALALTMLTYLSEVRHADRNFALAYFMKDAGVFETSVKTEEDLKNHLHFYFQLCSITGTACSMAAVASSLANGGTNPITRDKIFPAKTVRNCLSIMFSCGMYDYSGEFAYTVGLPAKSGVAGCVIVVVPNLLGLCIWSPRLDDQGNSVRAVEFCQRLTDKFAFHVFDDVISCSEGVKKKNPRLRQASNKEVNSISEICFAAANGNLTRVMEMVIGGVSVNVADYDGRTPLHLAAAEGRLMVAEYLINKGANTEACDRWGSTPLREAQQRSNCKALIDLLQRATPLGANSGTADHQTLQATPIIVDAGVGAVAHEENNHNNDNKPVSLC